MLAMSSSMMMSSLDTTITGAAGGPTRTRHAPPLSATLAQHTFSTSSRTDAGSSAVATSHAACHRGAPSTTWSAAVIAATHSARGRASAETP